MPDRFAIAQVTPYAWEEEHEVNAFVAALTEQLAGLGHRMLVLAPSRSPGLVRDSRRALRAAVDAPEALFAPDGEVRVLGVGELLPLGPGRRGVAPPLPMDIARTIEEALGLAALDFVHVHEPFAPSAASVALRHSRALNVGSFHAPTERVLSTQVARRFVERFFGRLDARTASFAATRELVTRYFPARYELLGPGAALPPRAVDRAGPVRIVFCDQEERAALRLFLRALRLLPLELAWEATVLVTSGAAPTGALRSRLRDRVRVLSAPEHAEQEVLEAADVVVAASVGAAPAPGMLVRALGVGAIPVAAQQALELRERLAARVLRARGQLGWGRIAQRFSALYDEVAARRRPEGGKPALRARLSARPLIDVDLHMHTDHSPDCATPVELLLATARDQRLGAIAVTDHNEVSGALEAREKAAEYGVKVIVAEEVKTAGQGEVIGLFLEEKIPRGLTLAETIAEIRRQGGLVYVPHPFDRLHTVPDYEHLLAALEEVDALEVFNARVAIPAFNEEAVRFAAKYRIVGGAGSDAHVAQGLGSVRIRMRDFEGPEEFLESLRDADIIRQPASLLYVQALKFLQTKATPTAARRGARDRRVRRAEAARNR